MKIIKGLHYLGVEDFEVFPGNIVKVDVVKDRDGNSWGDLRKDFKDGTWKLMVNESDNMIISRSDLHDPSFAFPYEGTYTVVEVDFSDLPPNFFDPGMFIAWSWFEDKGVVRRWIPDEENIATNKVMKQEVLRSIKEELEPLQLAEKHGVGTPEESERQIYLERLMIEVGRIDPKARDILWPVLN